MLRTVQYDDKRGQSSKLTSVVCPFFLLSVFMWDKKVTESSDRHAFAEDIPLYRYSGLAVMYHLSLLVCKHRNSTFDKCILSYLARPFSF